MTQGLHCHVLLKAQCPLLSPGSHFISHTFICGLGAGLLAFKYHFGVPGFGWAPSSLCPAPDRCFVPCVPKPGPAPFAKPHGVDGDH